MPVSPFGVIRNFGYLSDDGTWYHIGLPEEIGRAGQLPELMLADIAFPAIWAVRILVCAYDGGGAIEPVKRFVHVPCNTVHPGWNLGPGTHLVVAGHQYEVQSCRGERRTD